MNGKHENLSIISKGALAMPSSRSVSSKVKGHHASFQKFIYYHCDHSATIFNGGLTIRHQVNMERLLTIEDVCELLQISKSLIYKWVHYGFVPHIKIGTKLRFKESQIENWLKRREHKGRKLLRITIE